MQARIEDISRRRKGLHKPLLLSIALGAIFLLFLSAKGPAIDQESFLASVVTASRGSFVGEIRADKAVFPEAPELVFVGVDGLLATSPPITVTPQVLGAIVGQLDGDLKQEVTKYAVEEGDTPTSIAERFGISVETVLGVNDLDSSSQLKVGQQLILLPVSGALHLVRPHDTLSEIAQWYQADTDDIAFFNDFSSPEDIFVGDLLIIPGGITPLTLPKGRLTPLPNSYFIYPIPAPYRVTQGLHTYNAIDFSNAICGESVYAAAGGTVQKTGYTSLGGKFVRILHPNGVVTYYGHLSGILMAPGAKVYQGQTIGYSGNTGYTIPAGSAGCHLHFEVRGAINPFR